MRLDDRRLLVKGDCDQPTRNYLEQVPDVPLLANHVVVRLTPSNLRWLAMHENFLDDESHSAKSIGVSVLPDCVVVDLVNSIDEADLQVEFGD